MTIQTRIQNACIVTRLGKKAKIFDTLWELFPKNIHTFVDLFFGSGAMSFGAKAKGVPYIIANDLDDEIFNLYQVINQHKEEFLTQWNNTPISQSLFLHWKNTIENNHILKAVRFVYLTNYSFMAGSETFKLCGSNQKEITFDKVEIFYQNICKDFVFANLDFRKVLKNLSVKGAKLNDTFIYADPPYLNTHQNYNTQKFKDNDFKDLLELCKNSLYNFAISEFESPKILTLVYDFDLNVHEVGTRLNLKNTRKEILITNY